MHKKIIFPPLKNAQEDGLLCFSLDIDADFLIAAYSEGIFPWSSEPVTWWAPPMRAVCRPQEFKLRSRMQRAYRNCNLTFTINKAFKEVMECCADTKYHPDAWITPKLIEAYVELFQRGYGMSVEAWDQDNKLVGGMYGVRMGKYFSGESMFNAVSNASTFCLAYAMEHLSKENCQLFDFQVLNPHTQRLGAYEISREAFTYLLKQALDK